MIIKGSNHRWQAQIRWKKCWTTIHAFQELKQGNTEILGTVRPLDTRPQVVYDRNRPIPKRKPKLSDSFGRYHNPRTTDTQ